MTGNSVGEQGTVQAIFILHILSILFIFDYMMYPLYLPVTAYKTDEVNGDVNNEVYRAFENWFSNKMQQLQSAFTQQGVEGGIPKHSEVDLLTNGLVDILVHRFFNYQSKKNSLHILPGIRQTMALSIALGRPIPFLYLYNGGYRASPFPNDSSLIFNPDFTELMLLYQLALLHQKIRAVYSPGMEFTIVINNGVAQYVNEVPLVATQHYVQQLRAMINRVGAEKNVRVLVQSELPMVVQHNSPVVSAMPPMLSDKAHANIERFMGRTVTREESAWRALRYTQAESDWFQEISDIAHTTQAILLRQTTDPQMLSFRPFPGGAIRSQNGSLGFEYINQTIRLKLITSENAMRRKIERMPLAFPWQTTKNESLQYL